MKKRYAYLALALVLIFQITVVKSFAQSLSLDLTFSGDGMTTTNFGYYDYGRAVEVQSDGKIVMVGYSSATGSGDYNFAIVRFNTNGTLDNTFGTGGKVTTDFGTMNYDAAEAIAIQTDGKLVVGGLAYNTATSSFGFALARYNSNGTLDATFDTDGKVTTVIGATEDNIRGIVLQSDGKIVVVGYTINGTNDNVVIARYNSNGSLDNTFGTGGITVTQVSANDDWFISAALQSDGKIVTAGYTLNATDQDMLLARYTTAGVLDNTFGTSGLVVTNFGSNGDLFKSVVIQSDGKILAAGSTYNGTQWAFALGRFTSTGAYDNTFNSTGKVTTTFGTVNDQGQDIALQSDGKIVFGGLSSDGSYFDFAASRYNTNGTLDTGFDADGKLTTDISGLDEYSYSVAIQPDGKIVLAGHTVYSGAGEEFAVARYCPKAAQPGTITGNSTACNGTTQTYSISAVTGADDYTWSVPSGATINSGQGTTSISVTFGSSSGNVSVTSNNGCGSSPAQSKAITVTSAPATPGTISGTTAMCEGTTHTYSISSVSGATSYTWSVPAGAVINSGQGTTSINVTIGFGTGNITVTADNSCASSSASSLALNVTPLPYSFFSWSSVGLAVTFTNLCQNATSYSWAFGDAGTSSLASPVHNYATAGTYTVELTATGACGSDLYTKNITITGTGVGGDVGIEEMEKSLHLSVYPNPSSGKIQLDISGEIQYSHNYTIEIVNLIGESIGVFKIESEHAEIDLTHFSDGIYFLKCTSENAKGMIKVVKQ